MSAALELESPLLRCRLRELEGLQRNDDFNGPSRLSPARPNIPNAIPICVVLTILRDLPVAHRAGRVNREVESRTPVSKAVKIHGDGVGIIQIEIFLQFGGDNKIGLGVEADNADIHFVLIVKEARLGLFARRLTGERLLLDEVGRRKSLAPDRLVQTPVEGDFFSNAHSRHDSRQVCGLVVDRRVGGLGLLGKDRS